MIEYLYLLILLYIWTYIYAGSHKSPARDSFLYLILSIMCPVIIDIVIKSLPWLPHLDILGKIRLLTGTLPGVLFLYFAYKLTEFNIGKLFKFNLFLMIIGVILFSIAHVSHNDIVKHSWYTIEAESPLFIAIGLAIFVIPGISGFYLLIKKLIHTKEPNLKTQLSIIILGGVTSQIIVVSMELLFPILFKNALHPSLNFAPVLIFAMAVFLAVLKFDFLQISKEQAASLIFETSNDGIIFVSNNYEVLESNQTARKLFKQGKEANKGNIFTPIKDFNEEFPTIKIYDPKTPRHIRLSCSAMKHHGKTTGYMVITRDITEQKELEEQLLQAQKMEAIGRMAGGIAHDFNNIITGILNYCDFLDEHVKNNIQAIDDVGVIRDAAKRAGELTSSLLAFSRKQIVSKEIIDVNKAIFETSKMLSRTIGENIEIKLELSSDTNFVKINHGQFNQVIMNLIVNAKDAMPDGGKISIVSGNIKTDKNFQKKNPDVPPGDYVNVKISDTGFGMSEQVKEHIFDPFFTTKQTGEGTGLGLSTVYGISRQNNFKIILDSQPGKGSQFTLLFLKADENATTSTPPPPFRSAAGDSKTILIAEDEKIVLKSLSRILKSKNYNVISTSSGEDA
ncbi:MAG: hypothetical protein JXR91_05750, partial [Deltaproteobacteria bacterium]|nr:hypothetical protein [Deltaproteobacteria bacterium]